MVRRRAVGGIAPSALRLVLPSQQEVLFFFLAAHPLDRELLDLLPFKLLLFVLVDGWRLVVGMLLESFGTLSG